MTTAAEAGSAIRSELKAAFPKTKFSVTSTAHVYASSVRIQWAGGPTADDVWALVGKFEQGAFNHDSDCYEFSNLRDDIPQVKHVFMKRRAAKGGA